MRVKPSTKSSGDVSVEAEIPLTHKSSTKQKIRFSIGKLSLNPSYHICINELVDPTQLPIVSFMIVPELIYCDFRGAWREEYSKLFEFLKEND
jgi:hypothetical protein